MNDNDIIKVYKCCTLEACNCTANCPYRGTSGKFTGEECWRKAREDVLDLINRQKTEIERLTVNMNAFGLGMKREKERADTARAEAIKEFAERLNKQAFYVQQTEWDGRVVDCECINDLVKEMTEGEDVNL